MAVVDSQARVIGVRGLRVVDASSFALLPPGHPESTVCKSSRPLVLVALPTVWVKEMLTAIAQTFWPRRLQQICSQRPKVAEQW